MMPLTNHVLGVRISGAVATIYFSKTLPDPRPLFAKIESLRISGDVTGDKIHGDYKLKIDLVTEAQFADLLSTLTRVRFHGIDVTGLTAKKTSKKTRQARLDRRREKSYNSVSQKSDSQKGG
jgi:hypothetical protein